MTKRKDLPNKFEREYVIPLRVEWRKVPRYKRAAKAIKAIKEFLAKHMRIYDRDLKKIKVDKYLNEFVWFRGIKKPPHKIKVKAIKDGENVRVELVDYSDKLKFKKLRAEKLEKSAKAAKEKKKGLMEKMKEGAQAKPKEEKKEDEGDKKEGEEDKKGGEEGKKKEKEKAKAGEEAVKKLEKSQAKSMKHSTGGKAKAKTQPQRKALAK